MKREQALKVVLVLVGLLFAAGVYPLVTAVRSELVPNSENSVPMILSLYVTLGVFLLLAARTPSAYRSVIAFAAWSSLRMPPSWQSCPSSFQPNEPSS